MRNLMVAVACVALLLAGSERLRVYELARRYRSKAEGFARMERRCREIDAMDPAARARAAQEAYENFQEISHAQLRDVAWNRKLIKYLETLRIKYEHAALHPRDPVPPDPPSP